MTSPLVVITTSTIFDIEGTGAAFLELHEIKG